MSNLTSPSPSLTAADDHDSASEAMKYLTFRLASEEYGVEIMCVREIIALVDITALPQTPEYAAGVINLRGQIIPVIDLRKRFSLEPKEFTAETCIIVVEFMNPESSDSIPTGVIVDQVSEVLDIEPGLIEQPPQFGSAVRIEFIEGIGKTRDRVITLLNIQRALTWQELSEMAAAAPPAAA